MHEMVEQSSFLNYIDVGNKFIPWRACTSLSFLSVSFKSLKNENVVIHACHRQNSVCARVENRPARTVIAHASENASRDESQRNATSRARSGRTWDQYFRELTEFYNAHRHTSIPRHHSHPRLYQWCILQRTAWKKGKLSTMRYRQLSSIGFQWDLQFEKWKQMFYQLAEFKQSKGHCNVPLRLNTNENTRLARWVVKQRHLFKRGLLPDDRRRRLEGLGFSFSPDDDLFRRRLEQLSEWREKHGHANVPRSWVDDPGLARWTDSVRLRWRQGKLPMQYYRQLREIGFCFAPLEISWEAQLHDFQKFMCEKGHCSPAFIEDRRLHSWLALQRRRQANGTLPPSRAMQLYELGVDWRPQRVVFAERLEQLKKIYKATGSTNVPMQNERLRQWVAQIRALGRNRMSAANLKRLEALNFQFEESGSSLNEDTTEEEGEI